MIEVGAFERDAEPREKMGRRLLAGGHALPEPVVDGERPKRVPEGLKMSLVQLQVANLVAADLQQPSAEGRRRRWERENRPGHQLGRLELMVQKRVQDLCAPRLVMHLRRLPLLLTRDQLHRPARRGKHPRFGRRAPVAGRPRRLQLSVEVGRGDEIPGPALDGSAGRWLLFRHACRHLASAAGVDLPCA